MKTRFDELFLKVLTRRLYLQLSCNTNSNKYFLQSKPKYSNMMSKTVWSSKFLKPIAYGSNSRIYEVTAASPYINIQNGVQDEGNASDEEENDDEIFQNAEEEQITECWLIPEDVNTVDTIFQAMTECQA
uniref:Uncharacterized protein n=1 Tax=Glossina austeni TaxID=7395 RepID=A0A1A9UWW5_GLOAU